MSDVTIDNAHWRALEKSSCFYVISVIDVATVRHLSNSAIATKSKETGMFSSHVIGKAMNLGAVTHEMARKFVAALNALLPEDSPKLTDRDIVAAVFALPYLRNILKDCSCDVASLSAASGVSSKAIEHALAGGRVTGAIAHALRTALVAMGGNVSPLDLFASSDPSLSGFSKSITRSKPFSPTDLRLPLPSGNANPWPLGPVALT